MTKYLYRGIVTVVLIFATTPIQAQQWKVEMKELIMRPETARPVQGSSKGWTPEATRDAIRFAGEFIMDSLYQVRRRALEISHDIAMRSTDSVARQLTVNLLLYPLARQDHELTQTSLSLLTTFSKTDFSPYARDTIRSLFSKRGPNFNQLIKLAGFLELHDLHAALRTYSLTGNASSTRWAALLALARMGNENAMEDILRRVERVGLTDEVVYNVFPDLIYTRHPDAVAYLARLIQNDEKNCFTADAEREVPIPCAYRILELLASVIENFPLELDAGGDLKTNDYSAALALAREWFVKNPTYGIRNDKY